MSKINSIITELKQIQNQNSTELTKVDCYHALECAYDIQDGLQYCKIGRGALEQKKIADWFQKRGCSVGYTEHRYIVALAA